MAASESPQQYQSGIRHKENYKLCDTTKEERKTCSTAQKMKFSIKDFFSKCDQIRSFLQIWSHLLKKSVMENFISCAV